MRNRYPGVCYRCGKTVEKGEGHFEKVRGSWPTKWRTQHAECAIAAREQRDAALIEKERDK